ncbi:MAG: GlxA family transcriptional regulator [Proteobacteria bacterium]|nr:GlxA family transcriptional regulator [Pseudomonadota bacterium]
MKHISFLLADQFSMLGLLSAVEPLRAANQFRPGSFSWEFLSPDGTPITASNGMKIFPEPSSGEASAPFALFVCTGSDPEKTATRAVLSWLRHQAARHINMGGIDTGSVVLAKAGLLKGFRATVHWEHYESFREDFDQVEVTDSIFEIDRTRFTCSGGTASIDMMLSIISHHYGRELAVKISERFILEKIRHPDVPQKMPARLRYGTKSTALIKAIGLMEQHLEATLSIEEVADRVAISPRHLNRLFRDEVRTTPSAFYLELRLRKARQLSQQTDLTVAQIAVACGFSSSGYFSKVFKGRFGISPSMAP